LERRKFIQASAGATTALALGTLEHLSLNKKFSKNMDGSFALKILATNWGFGGTIDEYCSRVKRDGYDGIEIWWNFDDSVTDQVFSALKKYGLQVGFLCAGHEPRFQDNFASFTKMVHAAATNSRQRPLYINCHSGKDFFAFEDNQRFMDYTMQLAKETGIKICHETHRSRILYSAPVARQYFEKIEGLRITLDISHWCNVSESLLQDQQETVDLALERTDHVHARIGHQEGPQVNDPRAPEWEEAVKVHFAWWDRVVELKRAKGEVLTVLTEFGPPHYMPALPYTVQPVSDQWAINVHMMNLLRKRYG
jgi:sugar phosphate isomerase/epimerase